MHKRWVIGNWKMNGSQKQVAELLGCLKLFVSDTSDVVCAVCPPSLYVVQSGEILAGSEICLAAQNVCAEAPDKGAYTGEVSAQMLAQLSVQYVLVGHSERRQYYAESDSCVAAKFNNVLVKAMTPVLCIGESLAQKEAGQTKAHLSSQIKAVVSHCGIEAFANAIIAYEPIWAIGTGLSASPEQAQEIHAYIREVLAGFDQSIAEKVPLLYGGSVNSANAEALFAMQDINGVLVGGASLDANEFNAIYQIAR